MTDRRSLDLVRRRLLRMCVPPHAYVVDVGCADSMDAKVLLSTYRPRTYVSLVRSGADSLGRATRGLANMPYRSGDCFLVPYDLESGGRECVSEAQADVVYCDFVRQPPASVADALATLGWMLRPGGTACGVAPAELVHALASTQMVSRARAPAESAAYLLAHGRCPPLGPREADEPWAFVLKRAAV